MPWAVQAALVGIEKKCKHALARTESFCEAAVDNIRKSTAAVLSTEVRRIEYMLSGHTTRLLDAAGTAASLGSEDAACSHDGVRDRFLFLVAMPKASFWRLMHLLMLQQGRVFHDALCKDVGKKVLCTAGLHVRASLGWMTWCFTDVRKWHASIWFTKGL